MPKQKVERAVIAVASLGMFLSTLDSGIINVALPSLQHLFHTSVTSVAWTVTLYMMALSSTIVLFGRFGDRDGKLRIAAGGLIVFGIGSALCGAAHSLLWLDLARAVQGIGAAMLQATAVALITSLVAEERRGGALGTLGTVLGLGPVLGPALGGFLLSMGNWRWMFWINIPLCLAGLIIARKLAGVQEETRESPLNAGGNALFAATILTLLLGVAHVPEGMLHPATWLPLVFALLFGVLLVRHEARASAPIVRPDLLRQARFAIPFWATLPFGYATTVAFVAPPYFLQHIDHLPPWRVGLVSLCAPLGIAVLSKASGKIMAKARAGRMMTLGGVIMAASLGALCFQGAGWHPWQIGLLLFGYGVGYGIALPPVLSAAMGAAPREVQSAIGAAHRMNQNIGIALGAGIAAAILQSHMGDGLAQTMAGFRWSWLTATLAIGACTLSFAAYARAERAEDRPAQSNATMDRRRAPA